MCNYYYWETFGFTKNSWKRCRLQTTSHLFVFPNTKQYGMFLVNRVKLTERSKALDLSSATHSVCSNSTLCNLILLIQYIGDYISVNVLTFQKLLKCCIEKNIFIFRIFFIWQDIRTHSNNVWTLLIVV